MGDTRGEPVRLPPSLSEPPDSPPRIPLADRADSNEEAAARGRALPTRSAKRTKLKPGSSPEEGNEDKYIAIAAQYSIAISVSSDRDFEVEPAHPSRRLHH